MKNQFPTGKTAARRLVLAAGSIAVGLSSVAAKADPLILVGAGSLSGALATVATNFTAATGTPVKTMFAPSGTLQTEIRAGLPADLFASADLANPLALEASGLAGPVQNFASNQVVAVFASGYSATTSTLLATLLNPAITLGTSTPILDPLGDYTANIFAEANTIIPGAQATLQGKAQELVAAPTSPVLPAGDNSLVYFLDTTKDADVFITYNSSAVTALALDPGLTEVAFPTNLTQTAEYGLTILNGAPANTANLASYILSPAGQAVLASDGFGPPATVPEPASVAILVAGLLGLTVVRRYTRT